MFGKKTEEITTSPLPVKEEVIKEFDSVTGEKEMDFSEAIKEVISGKKIFRLEWLDRAYYGYLNGDVLSLHKPDGANYKWIISQGDLEGTDWIIIN
jgi:hypothetical protein